MKSSSAIKIMLGSLIAITVFHCLILVKVIPYEITWGGRLENDQAMYVFESVSLLINGFMIYVLLGQGKLISFGLSDKMNRFFLWVFAVLFALNTVGNILAKTNFEKTFALVTAFFVYLLIIMLKGNNIESKNG